MTGLASFTYQALPMRVVFGRGTVAQLPAELDTLGLAKVLVLCSPEQENTGLELARALGGRSAGVFAEARMHVPVETAHRAVARTADLGADGCLCVGGGSAIGLGKAVALESSLPVVAVPTTYAGSEMTPIWGLTRDGDKQTGRDPRVLPRSVVYDPDLTISLPLSMTITSGFNAMAHAVEALHAPDVSPIVSLMAGEGMRSLVSALPRFFTDSRDPDARRDALRGSWLCGAVLGATTMSLHHKLCHVLGGALDLPHASTHTVVLPHALAYNQSEVPEVAELISAALGVSGPPAEALWDLSGQLGAPRSLRELGMRQSDIAMVVDRVLAMPYANPRPVTEAGLTDLLTTAWAGKPPGSGG